MTLPLSEKQKKDITVTELARLIFRLGKEGKAVSNLPRLLETLCPENKKDNTLKDQPNQEFLRKFYEAIALLKRRGLLMDVVDSTGYVHSHTPGVLPTSVMCLEAKLRTSCQELRTYIDVTEMKQGILVLFLWT